MPMKNTTHAAILVSENEGGSRELVNNSSANNDNNLRVVVDGTSTTTATATSSPLLNAIGSNSSSPLLPPVVPPSPNSKLSRNRHIPAIDTSLGRHHNEDDSHQFNQKNSRRRLSSMNNINNNHEQSLASASFSRRSSSIISNDDNNNNSGSLGPRKSLSLPYPKNNPKERSNTLSNVKESKSLNRSKSLREGIYSRDSNNHNLTAMRKTESENGVQSVSSKQSLHHSRAHSYTPDQSPTIGTPEPPLRPLSSSSSGSLERRLSMLTQSYSDNSLSLSITDDNHSDWDDFLYGYARGKFDPLSIPRKPRRSSSKKSYTKVTTFGDDWDVEYIEAWRRDGARDTLNAPGTPNNGIDIATNYTGNTSSSSVVNIAHQHELSLTATEDSASINLETHIETDGDYDENNYEYGYDGSVYNNDDDEFEEEDENEDGEFEVHLHDVDEAEGDDEFEPEYLPPPLPPNESERRRALWRFQILNTSQDVNFSRIVRLVKQHFKVPISLISLVNTTHQWFKAEEGLGCNSTTREVSFCGHAILQETAEPFVVPDALIDWRFKKNPLVTGPPYIRFYAGAPLRTKDGHNLGTICLIDNNRREDFSADDRKVLKDFAKVVVRELELWADRLRLRVRNKMQTSIAEFSNFCLEGMKSQLVNKETGGISRKRESVWSKSPEKEPPENGDQVMQKCFDMAVKLMRDTLEVDALYLLEMPSLSSKPITSTGRPSTSDFSSFFLNSPPPEPGIKHLKFLASVGIELSTDLLSTPTTTSFLIHLMETHEQGYIFQNALPPLPALFPLQMQSGIVVPIYDNSQNAFGFLIALTTDTSRQFEDEERVYMGNFGVNVVSEVLKRRVIVADRAKGVFISSMSHELRTPLHGILASCELLEDSKMTDAQKELLKTIQGCGTSLISILNSVLDFAKLESEQNGLDGYQHSIYSNNNRRNKTGGRHHHTSSLSTIASSDEYSSSSSNMKSGDDGINDVISNSDGAQNHDNNSRTASSSGRKRHRILQKVDLVTIAEEVSESCSIGQEMLSAVYGASSNTETLENYTDSTATQLRKRVCDLLHPYQYAQKSARSVGDKNDPVAEQRHVELMLDIEPRSEGWCVMADDGSVRQILMNIIGNSLKFTTRGYVHISLTTVPTSEAIPNRISVLFTITDTGKGMSPHFLTTHLFQPFSQEDSLQAGTGLGLSIVKLLVEKMGGRLDVESALGAGTRVRIWLDFDLPPSNGNDGDAEIDDYLRDGNNSDEESKMVDDNDEHESSEMEKKRILQEFSQMQLCIYGVRGKLHEVVEKYFRNWHGMKRIVFEEQADRMRGDLLVINEDLDALKTVWFLEHHKQQQDNKRLSLSNLVSPLLNIAVSSSTTIKNAQQEENEDWDYSPIILVTSIAKYAKAADFVDLLQQQANVSNYHHHLQHQQNVNLHNTSGLTSMLKPRRTRKIVVLSAPIGPRKMKRTILACFRNKNIPSSPSLPPSPELGKKIDNNELKVPEFNSLNQLLGVEDTQQVNSPLLSPDHSNGIQISAKSLPRVVVMTPPNVSSSKDFSLSSSLSSSSNSSYEHSDENSDENLIFMPSPLITSPNAPSQNEKDPFFTNISDDNLTTTEPVSDFKVDSSQSPSSSSRATTYPLLSIPLPSPVTFPFTTDTTTQLASSLNSRKFTNATFTTSFDRSYSLPASPVPEIHQQSLMIAPTIVGPKGPRVLVVEDNAINRMILVTFLKKRGVGYEEAENGAIGVEKFRRNLEFDEEQMKHEYDERNCERRRFDVVLMDIQMPVMDGNKATAEIRKLEKEYAAEKRNIQNQESDNEHLQPHPSDGGNNGSFKLGRDLPNSLSTSPLISLLSPLLNTAANRNLGSSSSASDTSIIDINLETSFCDSQSTTTNNFATKPQSLFTTSSSSLLQNRALIFALTGLASEEDKDLAFESGVDGFLTKPISLKVLDRVLKRWFERAASDRKVDGLEENGLINNKSSNSISNPLPQSSSTSDAGLCNMVG
ncbi:11319_t:CDS:2 [Ambispora gerdemannii]|uniref:histidine kinase n=1 Tax=Ambispora gerdemannii TaxID=144530 RepID=A0A9N8VZG6_9GLOM|nr:11319_t:CDS:2 [Ambispora gerdemannii]